MNIFEALSISLQNPLKGAIIQLREFSDILKKRKVCRMITIEDIISRIIINHTLCGVTPIELKMINSELKYDDDTYLGDEVWKRIVNRVIKESGYILQFLPKKDGQHFVDYINLINPNVENAYNVEPGTRPTEYFTPILDPTSPEAQGFIYLLEKELYMDKKRKLKSKYFFDKNKFDN